MRLQVAWYHNGSLAPESGGRFEYESGGGGFHRLLIHQAQAADAGSWSLVATSPAGTCTTEAVLVVSDRGQPTEPPRFMEGLRDQVVEEGEGVRLKCRVEGAPEPAILWLKDGTKLRSSNNVKLSFEGPAFEEA